MSDMLVTSFSAYKLYCDCPGAYGLRYITREPIKALPDFTGTVPGKVVHSIAELYLNALKHGIDNPGFWTELVLPLLVRYEQDLTVNFTEDTFASSFEDAREKITNWSLNLFDLITDAGLVQPCMISELWFGSRDRPLIINDKLGLMGAVDLFSSKSKGVPGRLVDYKASESSYFLSKKQLLLYTIALSKLGYRVSSAGFLLFKGRKQDWMQFTVTQVEAFIDELSQMASRVQDEDLPFTPSKTACKFCERINSCDYAVKEDTPIVPQVKGDIIQVNLPDSTRTPEL